MNEGATGTLLIAGVAEDLQPALLARAGQIAEAAGLRVYLYYPLANQVVATPLPGIPAAALPGTANIGQTPELQAARLKRCQDELHNALTILRARGIEADGRVEWRDSRVSAVLEAVEEIAPRLVMTAAKAHGKLTDLLGLDDDLELIRLCPRPLWLVRRPPGDRQVMLAAVDPTHENDQACAVDHAVLDQANELARHLRKQAHAIHTFALPTRLPGVIEATAPDIVHERYQRADDHHTGRMHELAQAHGIRAEHVHVINGELVETLGSLTGPLDVDVIVTGALSRGRLRRMLIGGTAERLLRTVDTDILVVKDPARLGNEERAAKVARI